MKLSVASPCKREWSAMRGDDRVRFCGDCKLNVYNLSAMTHDEAQKLIAEREGKICARFFTRPDGTVLTKDCPVGVTRKRRAFGFSIAAIIALFAVPVFGAQQCPTGGGSLRASVRELIFTLKVKLGFANPIAPMMGDVAIVGKIAPMPPPPAGLTAAKH
jgi:hypothetical protein